ncbi:MAG: DNA polymerase I, partial [Oscillospiraceae bacterium]|nr:DNA polymerase I [Oscillospiraceae bacterium]
YKAQRKGMPPELASQLPVLKELLTALGLALVEAPGWEADDILGTLAAVVGDDDCCVLATGDRDALQLVTDRTQVWLSATKAGRPETKKCTPAAVREIYGLAPAQLIDLKALMGDSSDNIPGVAGVGEKTAQALLAQFGTLDGVYANLENPEIKAGIRQKLAADKDMAYLSRTLGTIKTNAPVPLSLAHYIPKAPDAAKVTRMLAELEMFKMIERLHLPAVAPAPDRPAARKSTDTHDLDALLAQLRAAGAACFVPRFAEDLLEQLTFAMPEADVIVPSGNPAFLGFCKQLLEDPSIKKYTTDTKQLWRWCMRNHVHTKNLLFDAALAGYLLCPGASGYDAPRLLQEYACGDFAHLCAQLEKQLRQNGQFALFADVELPLAKVLAQMELSGFAVDAAQIARFGAALDDRLQGLTKEITTLAGQSFNLNSPKQLGEVLFGKLGLRPPKKTKTGYSTNAETLEALRDDHPIIAPILEYRTLIKLKSTYCDSLIKQIEPDGRIHSRLNQTETRTGRISSSEPNLQNIPIRTPLGRQLRDCFVAAPGCLLVDADYSQIELRVMAAMAREETMLRAFRDGVDIHTLTASQVFDLPPQLVLPEMRNRAKAVNFGIIYGIGAFSLAKDIGVSFREAETYINAYFAHYPQIRAFRAERIAQAKANGYAETLFGRRRALTELTSSQRSLREFGERAAVNMPVQGTAADIIKIAMVRVAQRLEREGLQARLILQVHDELLVESPTAEAPAVKAILREEMEQAATLAVPLLVEVGAGLNWNTAH